MPEPKEILILDGSMASELERLGCDLRHRLWSARVLVEEPERIARVHRSYLEAGADCITTAGYQASIPGFKEAGLSLLQAEEAFRNSVRLAFDARAAHCAEHDTEHGKPEPLIAASLGPYGAYLADGSEYTGAYNVSPAQLEDFHGDRLDLTVGELRAHGDPGRARHIILFETIPGLEEALLLARLLERHTDMRAWLSFSCSDGEHTSVGERLEECARALEPFSQITAIGVNCTPPRRVASLLGALGTATTKRLLAYPNSGEEYDADSGDWRGTDTLGRIEAVADEWVRAGARVLGGCCRTTPEQIGRLVRWKAARRF